MSFLLSYPFLAVSLLFGVSAIQTLLYGISCLLLYPEKSRILVYYCTDRLSEKRKERKEGNVP
jgi:hypothetical protein